MKHSTSDNKKFVEIQISQVEKESQSQVGVGRTKHYVSIDCLIVLAFANNESLCFLLCWFSFSHCRALSTQGEWK
jgi:hypothetical protein